MADTIITNTPDKSDSGAAGWVVALILIIALAIGGIVLYKRGAFRTAAAPNNSTNVNLTVPTGTNAPGNGDTSGSATY